MAVGCLSKASFLYGREKFGHSVVDNYSALL